MPTVIFTIGHSTRTLEEFVEILRTYAVAQIVDIRTVPRSRRNPQFNRETLPKDLKSIGVSYVHMSGLGGLRHPKADSPNMAWRNISFRGFADYMGTIEFETNLGSLVELAEQSQIVIMCVEAVPWRCHRLLISDALLVRGIQVEHIFSITKKQAHTMTPWAKIEGKLITYPSEDGKPQ